MSLRTSFAILLLPVALLGCAANVLSGDALGDADENAVAEDASELERRVAARCALAESGTIAPATLAEFEGHLVKRWFRCSAELFFDADDAGGFELLTDGTWHLFDIQADGSITARTGFDSEGRWSAKDMQDWNGPGSFQLDLDLAGGGSDYLQVRFAAEADRAHMSSMGGDFELVALPE